MLQGARRFLYETRRMKELSTIWRRLLDDATSVGAYCADLAELGELPLWQRVAYLSAADRCTFHNDLPVRASGGKRALVEAHKV